MVDVPDETCRDSHARITQDLEHEEFIFIYILLLLLLLIIGIINISVVSILLSNSITKFY